MSRKFKQAEDAVTSRVMPLLDRKLYGWTLTEQQLPFIEDTKHPDMMGSSERTRDHRHRGKVL